ncbi:MAG: hypothetical protein Q9225_005364 [Loekoesia sp. 1 TL-2023]
MQPWTRLPIIAALFLIAQLVSSQIDRSGWHCHVDSSESGDYDCAKAIDGDFTTFWHTKWDPVTDYLPHNITIDIRTPYNLASMMYLPRQDGNQNGNIGDWQIMLGNDTQNGRFLTGTWSDDQQLKTVDFVEPTVAQFLVLTAFTEAGDRGMWSSAAEINIFKEGEGTPPTSGVAITTTQSGSHPASSTKTAHHGDSNSLGTLGTVFTVIGGLAAAVALLFAVLKFCVWGR